MADTEWFSPDDADDADGDSPDTGGGRDGASSSPPVWRDADARLADARRLVRRGNLAATAEVLRHVAELDPYAADVHLLLGQTLERLGRPAEAVRAFETLLAIRPDDVHGLNGLGIALRRGGRVREAITAFERAEHVDPAFEPPYCNRVLCHVDLGEHDAAERTFYLARLFTDVCPTCDYHLGRSLAARGMNRKAVACFRRVIEHRRILEHGRGRREDAADADDLTFQSYLRLGEVHAGEGRPEEAARCYGRASATRPEDPGSSLAYARVLLDLGRLEEASRRLRSALRDERHHVPALVTHARLCLLLGRDAAAEAAARRALSHDPTCCGPRLTLARVAARVGNAGAARRLLRDELVLGPDDPRSLADVAHLLLDLDDPRLATVAFRRLTRLTPRSSAAWQNLGVAEAQRGRPDDAARASARALSLDPLNVAAAYNLVLALIESDRLNDAARHLAAARRQSPRDEGLSHLSLRLKVLRVRRRLRTWWGVCLLATAGVRR